MRVHVNLNKSKPGRLVYVLTGADRSQLDPRTIVGDNSKNGVPAKVEKIYVTHVVIKDCSVWQLSRKKLYKRARRDVVIGHEGKFLQSIAKVPTGKGFIRISTNTSPKDESKADESFVYADRNFPHLERQPCPDNPRYIIYTPAGAFARFN